MTTIGTQKIDALSRYLLTVIFLLPFSAFAYDTRAIDEVISSSDIVLSGAVVGSGIGNCGKETGNLSYYTIRVTQVVKGSVPLGDVKACGSAPLLLGNRYVIFGEINEANEIEFSSDAVLLAFPSDEYYRLISYASPVVASDRGEAYAVGILERDFAARLQAAVGGKSVNLRSE